MAAGGWAARWELQESRQFHSSWQSRAGLLLLGGRHSPRTTELLPPTGSRTVAQFRLVENTMSVQSGAINIRK